MKTPLHVWNRLPLVRWPSLLVTCCGMMFLGQSTLRAEASEAVASSVSDAYSRTRLPDGSFRPETYTFGDGGHVPGGVQDPSIERLSFMDVARVIAPPLARRNYVPATDRNPANTRLLIMVYWGTTHGTAGATSSNAAQNLQASAGSVKSPPPIPTMSYEAHCSCDATQMNTNFAAAANAATQSDISSAFAVVAAEGRLREAADRQNAELLGYDAELAAASRLQLTAFRNRREDLTAEVEENRDFIVLKAYDFQALWKQKQHRLLWVTRLSVRQRGTDFAAAMPALVGNASQYFGRDSQGLMRNALPEGKVEFGDIKSLGVVTMK